MCDLVSAGPRVAVGRVAVKRVIRKVLLISFVLLVGAMPRVAAAQSASRVDAAGGYAWLRDHDGDVTFSRGWFASVGADVVGPLGIVGDISSSEKSQSGLDVELSVKIQTFMAGPRIAMHTRRVTPFAQMLFGTIRITSAYSLPGDYLSASQSYFATQLGGGVDVHLLSHIGVRLGAHYRLIRVDTTTLTGSQPLTYYQTQAFGGLVVR